MASVIASFVTMWSIKVTTMAMATSTLKIVKVIIVIPTKRGVKLSTVVLVLASIIILLSPSPLLRPSIWLSTTYIDPCRVYGLYYYLCKSHCGSSYLHLHTVLLVQGDGEVVKVAVVVSLCFSFLSSGTSCTLEWFRCTCGSLDLEIVLYKNICWELILHLVRLVGQ